MPARALGGSLAATMIWWSATAVAQEGAPQALPPTALPPPIVSSSSEQLIPGKDFELRPEGRPADILRLIPGLIIGQHQGGGKAEQYLIRGFDADHGTDIALFVDGLPVNLRSHAHGQGYADLHFLIPETVHAGQSAIVPRRGRRPLLIGRRPPARELPLSRPYCSV